MTPQTKIELLREGVGIVLLAYVAYCVARGQIGARVLGTRARPVLRSENPMFFWFVIGCHVTVALAIMFVSPAPTW